MKTDDLRSLYDGGCVTDGDDNWNDDYVLWLESKTMSCIEEFESLKEEIQRKDEEIYQLKEDIKIKDELIESINKTNLIIEEELEYCTTQNANLIENHTKKDEEIDRLKEHCEGFIKTGVEQNKTIEKLESELVKAKEFILRFDWEEDKEIGEFLKGKTPANEVEDDDPKLDLSHLGKTQQFIMVPVNKVYNPKAPLIQTGATTFIQDEIKQTKK